MTTANESNDVQKIRVTFDINLINWGSSREEAIECLMYLFENSNTEHGFGNDYLILHSNFMGDEVGILEFVRIEDDCTN